MSLLIKRIHAGKVKTRITLDQDPIPAPIEKGQRVGKIEVVVKGQVLSEISLISAEEVPRKTWLDHLLFWKN